MKKYIAIPLIIISGALFFALFTYLDTVFGGTKKPQKVNTVRNEPQRPWLGKKIDFSVGKEVNQR